MKVIIPTKNRQATISTHRADAFQGHDVTVLVHDAQQENAYLSHNPGLSGRVVVTGMAGDTFGLTRQREWACQHLVDPGEWFVFADDNIEQVTGVWGDYRYYDKLNVQGPESGLLRTQFAHVLDGGQFRQVFEEDVSQADYRGAHLVGFATTGNHYFRGTKWRSVGYVIGKMMLWHNVPYEWDHTVSMEDFAHTGEHLLQHGSVLIDNYTFPKCGHYQPGGMGTYAERIPQRKKDVLVLMHKYPGLFRVKERKDFEYGTDLAVRFTSPLQVQAWRHEMGVA